MTETEKQQPESNLWKTNREWYPKRVGFLEGVNGPILSSATEKSNRTKVF